MTTPTPEQRRQAYEAEKAELNAVNAPPSAYARLDEAFFGTPPAAAGAPPTVHNAPIREWLGQHLDGRWSWVLATAGALILALLIEGTSLVGTALKGWQNSQTAAQKQAAEAQTASYVPPDANPLPAADVPGVDTPSAPAAPKIDPSTCAADGGQGDPNAPFAPADKEAALGQKLALWRANGRTPPCAPPDYHYKP